MKNTRLILGIISMVLFLLIIFQSCAAGLGNALEDNGEVSGSAGTLLAFLMLSAGIVGVAGRKSKVCAIVAGGLYAVGGLVGIANVGSFGDLRIWSILSLCFAGFFILSGIFQKKNLSSVE